MDNLDLAIIFGFLVLILIYGVVKAQNKELTLYEYALGGRSFSTFVIMATVVATWASGSGFFSDLNNVYSQGLFFLIPVLGMGGSLYITSRFLIPRMDSFLGVRTLPEAMGNFYGKEIRLISAITGIIGVSGSIAIQFKAMGQLTSYFSNIPEFWAIGIVAIIIVFYCAFGGIRSVIHTDVIQGLTFSIAIPVTVYFIWTVIEAHHSTDFSILLNNKNFQLSYVLDYKKPEFWNAFILLLYFIIPTINPSAFQRISIGQNIWQTQEAWRLSSIGLTVVTVVICTIPVLLIVAEPNLNLEHSKVFGHIISNYSTNGIRGILVVGLIAMVMSTADSHLNSSVSIIVNDILPKNLKTNEKKTLYLMTILIGVFSFLIALRNDNLLDIILWTNSFYMPIVTVPLLFTIWGAVTTKRCVLIGMGAGGITVLAFWLLDITYKPLIPAMFANAITLVISHFLLEKTKFYKKPYIPEYPIPPLSPEEKELIEKVKKDRLYNYKLFSYLPYLQNNFVFTGIFQIFIIALGVYFTPIERLSYYCNMLLYTTALFCSVMLILTQPALYIQTKLRIEKFLYYFSIFLILLCLPIYFLFINDFNSIFIVIVISTIIYSMFVLHWKEFAIFFPIAIFSAIESYYYISEKALSDLCSKENWISFSLIIIFILLVFKKVYNLQKGNLDSLHFISRVGKH